MIDPAPVDLLGYLLDALDDPEQALVEKHLQNDPQARQSLALAERRLACLAPRRIEREPPPGLAARTCQFVADRAGVAGGGCQGPGPAAAGVEAAERDLIAAPRPRPALVETAPPAGAPHWRWQDIAVAVAVFAALGALVFPAIHGSRFRAQVTACQNNLRELGTALSLYSQQHGEMFPPVPAEGRLGVAGIYGPTLVTGGYVADAGRMVCPGSPLAGGPRLSIPTLDQLESLPDGELARLLPSLGGSYGYSLGYTDQGTYRPTKNLHRATFAVLADAPDLGRPGRQSDNHGGLGQNVWCEDGHVQFVPASRLEDTADDFFENDRGLIAAGAHANDAVVAPSAARAVGDRAW